MAIQKITSGIIQDGAIAAADIVSVANTAITGNITSSQIAPDQTLNGNVSVTGTLNTPNTFGFKNRIINGGMVIDQRNAGASVTINNIAAFQYVVDRFYGFGSTASKFTLQQNAASVTPPVGFKNYLGATSLSAYSITSSDIMVMGQEIEGFNVADLGWGTANAQSVTLSFWVYSSLTGTFGGAISNSAQDRSYPFSYTISSANTWEQKTVTIAGDTSGSWLTTNGVGLRVRFGLGCGSTFSGTAGAWTGGNLFSATGATSVVGTNGATFYITGVQLEKGSTATSFDYRPYGTELALCQRYFQLMTNGASGKAVSGGGGFYTAAIASCPTPSKVTMRTTPTISSNSGTNYWAINNNGTSTLFNAFDGIIGEATADIAGAYVTGLSRTAGHFGYFQSNNASAFLAFQAEL